MGDFLARAYIGLLFLSLVVVAVWIVGLPVTLIASILKSVGHSAINFWLGKWWMAMIALIIFAGLVYYLLKLCCDSYVEWDDISLEHTV